MKRLYKEVYKGHEIWITDWSNISTESDLIDTIWQTTEEILSYNKKNLLELVIFYNSIVTKNVLLEMQKAAKKSRMVNKKKAALTDFSSTRLFILKTINRFSSDKIEPFTNKTDALEWLIQ